MKSADTSIIFKTPCKHTVFRFTEFKTMIPIHFNIQRKMYSNDIA